MTRMQHFAYLLPLIFVSVVNLDCIRWYLCVINKASCYVNGVQMCNCLMETTWLYHWLNYLEFLCAYVDLEDLICWLSEIMSPYYYKLILLSQRNYLTHLRDTVNVAKGKFFEAIIKKIKCHYSPIFG